MAYTNTIKIYIKYLFVHISKYPYFRTAPKFMTLVLYIKSLSMHCKGRANENNIACTDAAGLADVVITTSPKSKTNILNTQSFNVSECSIGNVTDQVQSLTNIDDVCPKDIVTILGNSILPPQLEDNIPPVGSKFYTPYNVRMLVPVSK